MKPRHKRILLHSSLFIITFITTTLAGAEWTHGKSILMEHYTWSDFASGLPYSVSFLLILTVHEFGHYFTAIRNRVKTTLPYYIPLPPFFPLIGTLGALIRIKTPVKSRQQHFDIGVAGPLAGFVVAMLILFYGFTHLPPADYVFQFHPEYKKFGMDYVTHVYKPEFAKEGTVDVVMGKNLIFTFFENYVADPARMPNPHEIMHYPLLLAGYFSLLFTCLNLLPIGQLDGGHVLYGLVGYTWHKRIASVIYIGLIIFTGLGFVSPAEPADVLSWKIPAVVGFLFLCLSGFKLSGRDTLMFALAIFVSLFVTALFWPQLKGNTSLFLFLLLIGRFVGIAHPHSPVEESLSLGRKIIGWVALLIFVLCFTTNPW